MSSAWTPAKGMLVAFEGGWHVTGRGTSPTVLIIGTRLLPHYPGAEERVKPLAPAPTAGGLWDALKGIPGAHLTHYEECDCGEDDYERGCCIMIPTDLEGPHHSGFDSEWHLLIAADGRIVIQSETTYGSFINMPFEHPQFDQWIQRARALAAYAAQPGWGGGE